MRPLSSRQNSEPRCRLVHFGSPPHRHRQRQPDMCLIRQEQASTARRSWRSHERDLAIFFGASDPQSRAVTRKAEPRDPPNAECTGINWTCIGGYNHLTFTANMRAVVFVFVDLSWRRGLCAKKSRRGTAIEKKMTGGRRRRERGAGGRARCVWWPRCEHCDCAALKSARAGSRQKVSRRALRKEPRSDFFSCFLNENELEIRN